VSSASERPAVPPIQPAQSGEFLLSPVDPTCVTSGDPSSPPAFPPGYDPEWALKRYPVKRKARKIKAPKDSKIYKAVLAVLALQAQGHKRKEIADALGLTDHTVRQYLYTANKRGWLNHNSFIDPEDQLDIVLRSKAVRNINTVLDEQEEIVVDKETGEKELTGRLSDRAVDMTKEVAKGLGMLKSHSVEKGITAPPVAMALRVQVEIPQLPANSDHKTLPLPREGSVGGVPVFDAEIVGDTN
jgi:predicted transcriptional regulator